MRTKLLAIAASLAPAAAMAHEGHGHIDSTAQQVLHLLLDHGLVVLVAGAALALGWVALRAARKRR
jgi:hypothetical protein